MEAASFIAAFMKWIFTPVVYKVDKGIFSLETGDKQQMERWRKLKFLIADVVVAAASTSFCIFHGKCISIFSISTRAHNAVKTRYFNQTGLV